ncbi:MAG: cytochrome C [Arcobacter sp.]|nr:MAG: cytochrome C [Arcobacter sp.]
MKTTKILTGLLILGATSLFAADGAGIYKSCAGCHGANAEKPALGKSEVIKGWDAAKIESALKGYKDGSYGKAMKGVMKGQVARLTDEDIKAVSAHISALK